MRSLWAVAIDDVLVTGGIADWKNARAKFFIDPRWCAGEAAFYFQQSKTSCRSAAVRGWVGQMSSCASCQMPWAVVILWQDTKAEQHEPKRRADSQRACRKENDVA